MQVWALRVDTHVLDHGGNLIDACVLSALGALMAFRKPEVCRSSFSWGEGDHYAMHLSTAAG